MNASSLGPLLDEFSRVLANDPGALEVSSAMYVPHLHGVGAEDVIALLERAIRRTDDEGQIYYFSGQRGTGKSTELRRLATQLNGQPDTRAYVVDALEYISDTHPLDTLSLLLVAAIAFADRLAQPDGLGEAPQRDDGLLARFTGWLRTEVDITEVSIGGVKAEFRKQQQSIVERLRNFDLTRQERVMAECRAHLSDMADAVRATWKCRRVVLAIDSLERLRGIGGEAGAMFDRIVQVFDGGIAQLRVPGVQMIYSVPPYLPYLTNVKALVRLFVLASVRVCQPPSTARREARIEGVAAMRQVVERRFPRWRELISEPALDRLILASGGDLRQLLRRLVLDVLDEAYFQQERLPLQAGDAILDVVLERHRAEIGNLVVRNEFPLLQAIAKTHALDLQRREDLPIVAHFFDVRAVLNYRNGVEWLDLNPLLWQLIESSIAPSLAPVDLSTAAQPPSAHEPRTV